MKLSEANKEKQLIQEAEQYYDKYQEHMDLLEASVMAICRGGLNPYDVYALGKQLDAFEEYIEFCEEAGNTNLLGTLPKVAFDVITAVQGASILPAIASIQPIEEENGTVYFKNVRAEETRGNLTAGDVLVDPRQGVVTPDGYASNQLDAEVNATVAATLTYSFTLLALPLKSESLKIFLVGAATIQGEDVGPKGADKNIGTIFGAGVSGTINYTTGDLDLVFAADPGNDVLRSSYQQNFERSTDIPQIQSFFDSTSVKARVYALKMTVGMLQSFGMKKRFGMSAQEMASSDLVTEVNREVGGDAIRKLKATAALQVVEVFDPTPPASVSFFEHKQTYKDSIANAEANLIVAAGRGSITTIIAGIDHTKIIQTLPGFTKLTDGSSLGAHIFGTLDGITIIRVTEAALLPAKEALCLWKGATPFEAPCVWSPYMPLAVTGTLPEAPNPLVSMQAAAVWGALETIVPNFVTRLNIA